MVILRHFPPEKVVSALDEGDINYVFIQQFSKESIYTTPPAPEKLPQVPLKGKANTSFKHHFFKGELLNFQGISLSNF